MGVLTPKLRNGSNDPHFSRGQKESLGLFLKGGPLGSIWGWRVEELTGLSSELTDLQGAVAQARGHRSSDATSSPRPTEI